jgi:hypothetical protein
VFTDLTVRENLEMGGITLPNRVRLKEGIERALAQFPALKPRLKQRAGSPSGGVVHDASHLPERVRWVKRWVGKRDCTAPAIWRGNRGPCRSAIQDSPWISTGAGS